MKIVKGVSLRRGRGVDSCGRIPVKIGLLAEIFQGLGRGKAKGS